MDHMILLYCMDHVILLYCMDHVTLLYCVDHVNHLIAKIIDFFIFPNITIYTTTTKSSSLLQNLMGFLLQLTEMTYYIMNGRY